MYHHPLKGISADDVEKTRWPNPLDPARVKGLKEDAKKIQEAGFPVMMGNPFGAGVFEMVLWLQGFEDGFTNLIADRRLTHKLLDKMMDLKLKFWDLYLTEVGEYVDVVIDGDDVGIQESPMLSRAMYREYVLPRVKTIYSFIKKKAPNVFIFFHSCGSIYDILPDILETGADILNPVQVSAAKMDTARLKKEFGDRLVFWGGGADTQEILPHGTPHEVKEEVRRRIGDLAPGGGFVFNTVHNIQHDVPPENIIAMWEAVREYGKY
jgi:uroporphyrinogen decarboxylase